MTTRLLRQAKSGADGRIRTGDPLFTNQDLRRPQRTLSILIGTFLTNMKNGPGAAVTAPACRSKLMPTVDSAQSPAYLNAGKRVAESNLIYPLLSGEGNPHPIRDLNLLGDIR